MIFLGKVTHVKTPEGGRGLTAGEKLVLYALSNLHGAEGNFAVATQADLAHWCRLAVSGVRKITRALQSDGALAIYKPKVSRHGAPFHYVVIESKLYEEKLDSEDAHSEAFRLHSVQPEGYTLSPPTTKANQSNLNTGEVGSSGEVPKLGKNDGSADVRRARTHARKRGRFSGIDLEAVEGLLMHHLRKIDAHLASGIISDCLGVNPTVTTEEVLFVLSMIFAEGIPANIKKPAGYVRTMASSRVRETYLRAVDDAARSRMAAAGRQVEAGKGTGRTH
jgi:hypothetical protein